MFFGRCATSLVALVTVLALSQIQLGLCGAGGDFGFSEETAPANDDFETELADIGGENGRGADGGVLIAHVGRVFHWTVRSEEEVQGGYEIKAEKTKGIPSWLLFEKKNGIFWGVPLSNDVGVIRLSIKPSKGKSKPKDITINVINSDEVPEGVEKCPEHEDTTILTLTLDKNIRAIKPKQRVIAINNIAKFFGLPYSAFKLKPQLEKDDLTDSSIVLAGPGNLRTRNSKVISLLQVPVGCDGRLWISTSSIIHQLKQQARDGTIAEVLRLPLIGWRVKTETKPVLREKRQASDDNNDFGSGDYNDEDEYYDDYEEYEDEVPSSSKDTVTQKSTTTTTTPSVDEYDNYDQYDDQFEIDAPETSTASTTTTTSAYSSTHPHRHHHGELNPSVTASREHSVSTQKTTSLNQTPKISPTLPPVIVTTTMTTTTKELPAQPKPNTPDSVLKYDDNYAYGEYDDEDEDGPEESATLIPNILRLNQDNIQLIPEVTTTEDPTFKTTFKETTVPEPTTVSTTTTTSSTTTSTTTSTTPLPQTTTSASTSASTTVPSTTSTSPSTTPSTTTTTTTTTTETPTTFAVIEETMPEVHYTTVFNERPTSVEDNITQQQTVIVTTTPIPTTTPSTTAQARATFAVMTDSVPMTDEETVKVTTVRHVPSTTVSSTAAIPEVTEIEYHENFAPFVENRLKQISVTAGKIFRFEVPHNTFKDFEDEYNLTYELLDSNNRTVTNNTWLHFNPNRREVYGLPLEEAVSKWVFWVRAFDKEGAFVQEKLNIQVQQHKLDLVVNHEFSLQIRIEKQQEFTHYVDWSLKVLRALGKIYNTNMTEITVRRINYTSEPVMFTWSNDSVPTNYCPKTEIEELYKTLTANDRGDPSRELNMALAPELRVKKVLYKELGLCEPQQTPVTPPMNFSPILRNPIDNVNATVGELLIFKVKDDTFYDPEDVDPSMLNITLLTSDRQAIPTDSWLQFDSKNKEFFGIPRKVGRSEYQLVCVDSGGLPASDSLEVIVHPPPKRNYNIEFSMNITDVPYQTFVNSANLQKKFVEKLMRLFGETTPSNFHFLPFKQSYDSAIVTWFNKSLPTTRCPTEEIRRLESVLHNMNDKSISHKVHNIMEPEFRVATIKVHPIGNCKPKVTQEPQPEVVRPVEESTPQSSSDEYLITFIVPAVIIAVMLFLAAMAAIVLYRRRRMGKMTVEEDGRQSYGNKGIAEHPTFVYNVS